MKKIIYLSLLLMLVSCNKKIINDPEDTLFVLNVDVNLPENSNYYLVVENAESEMRYLTLSNFYIFLMKRGETIKGNTINLHFILTNATAENSAEIKSFYEVPLGKTIYIRAENLKSAELTNTNVAISFLNTPSFEVVTRSAKTAQQAFTLNSMQTPITTAALGGDVFNGTDLFYACFQNASSASYKLERIPEQSTYSINFSSLNTSMRKYTIDKTYGGVNMSHIDIQAYDNPVLYGTFVELFNLDDFSLFPSTTFDMYIPSAERQLGYFVQNYQFKNTTQTFTNWFYNREIITNFTLLNADLSISSATGFPIILSNPDAYDIAEIKFATDNFRWTIYSPNTTDFYIPEIPIEIIQEFTSSGSLLQMLTTLDGGLVKLIDYQLFENYESLIDIYFGNSEDPLYPLNSSYKTQEQSIQF
ncbi:MAG TPA: hypothetical protein DCG69_02025 [Bacteroidales bacterium]|nr:hypothetical protein [Bacteroidales bacterium]